MHAGIERPGHSGGGGVGRRDHRAHGGMEILACVGVDPSLVRIGSCGAGVNVAPHFRINPEAGQQRAEQNFVRLRVGGGEKIRNVVVAGGR